MRLQLPSDVHQCLALPHSAKSIVQGHGQICFSNQRVYDVIPVLLCPVVEQQPSGDFKISSCVTHMRS